MCFEIYPKIALRFSSKRFFTNSFFIDLFFVNIAHHSKIQKDGKAKYIPNFQFLLLNGDNIHSTSNEDIWAQKISNSMQGNKSAKLAMSKSALLIPRMKFEKLRAQIAFI